ncbi:MAG: NUDIX domain-containing protein [Erysipelotrichaceae bacterium]|nr:NUDIX domain-containing protein [Erysipelotrichaceae bacterium]
MAELVTVYDENGQSKGYAKTVDTIKDDELILAVHIYLYDKDKNFLLQQRAFDKKELPGLWCITGGKVQSDEHSSDAVVRETKEELGLTLDKNDLNYLGRCLNNGYIVDIYTAYSALAFTECKINKAEVNDIKTLNLNELLAYINSLSINETNYLKLVNDKLIKSIK